MSPGECYGAYLAIRQHFGDWGYDYFKYKGKLRNVRQSTFDARTDKWVYEKISRHKDPVGLIVSHLLVGPAWVGEIARDAGDLYLARQKRVEGLTYLFKNELSSLEDDFDALFVIPERSHPPLVKAYLGGQVSPETLSILVDVSGCEPHWRASRDPLVEKVTRTAIKYKSFFTWDVAKFSAITIDRFS